MQTTYNIKYLHMHKTYLKLICYMNAIVSNIAEDKKELCTKKDRLNVFYRMVTQMSGLHFLTYNHWFCR